MQDGGINLGKKLVPELRFPEFQGEWKKKELGELCKFVKNYSYSRKDEGQGKYCHIHYGDIHAKYNGYINESTDIPSIKNTGEHVQLKKGDVIVADASEDYTDLGKAITILDPGNRNIVAGLHTFALRPTKDLNSLYLQHYTRSNSYQRYMCKAGTGVSVYGINKTNISKLQLCYPSLQEQRKIGELFYIIDKKLELQQKLIETLEEYKKGMMQKIFSQEIRFKDDNGKYYPEWEEKRLGEVADVIMGQSPNSNSYNNTKEGMPLIQGNADIKGRLTAPQRYTTEPTTVCIVGDLILTVRAPVGCIAKSIHKGCIGRGVCIIRSKHNAFLFYYLQKNELLWNRYAQGSTFTAINSRNIKNFELIMPTKDEQNKIVNFLSLLDKKIELEKGQLENIKEFKKGLMQKMFV